RRGAAALPPEVARRGSGPLRLLARPPGPEDAGHTDAATLRERPPDRGVARSSPRRRAGPLPRTRLAPTARARRPPDGGLRRHDLRRARGVGGRRPPGAS